MRGKTGLCSVTLVSVNKLKLLAIAKNKLLSGKQNLCFSHRTVTSRSSHTATAQTLIHSLCDRCCFNFHILNLQSSSETSPWMLRVKVHSSSDLTCLIRLYMTHTNVHSLISIVSEKWHTQKLEGMVEMKVEAEIFFLSTHEHMHFLQYNQCPLGGCVALQSLL